MARPKLKEHRRGQLIKLLSEEKQIIQRNAYIGCVTQAAMNGVREFVIMRQTGHKTIATLRRYIRSGEIFRENAAAGLGI
jgi:hypothetical protein